ncbi:hypothetical protein Tco_1455207, partial [Tanacetum coccineum]
VHLMVKPNSFRTDISVWLDHLSLAELVKVAILRHELALSDIVLLMKPSCDWILMSFCEAEAVV